MSRESATRKALVETLRKIGFDAMAVDNEACMPGTPDVNWATCAQPLVSFRDGRSVDGVQARTAILGAIPMEGWIEIKKLDAWPARSTTVVRVDHFTEKQRIWIRNRVEHGGNVTMLLHVGKGERVLLPGRWAAARVGKTATEADIRSNAIATWMGSGRDVLARALLLSNP